MDRDQGTPAVDLDAARAGRDTPAERPPLETAVRPFDLDWIADNLGEKDREVRRYALELADDDAEGSAEVRRALDVSRDAIRDAQAFLREAATTLRAAKGEDKKGEEE